MHFWNTCHDQIGLQARLISFGEDLDRLIPSVGIFGGEKKQGFWVFDTCCFHVNFPNLSTN